MSRMNGGEFLRFILGCWHSLTTLSMSFQVFSMVLRSMTSLVAEPGTTSGAGTEEEEALADDVTEGDDEEEEELLLMWFSAPCSLDKKPPRGLELEVEAAAPFGVAVAAPGVGVEDQEDMVMDCWALMTPESDNRCPLLSSKQIRWLYNTVAQYSTSYHGNEVGWGAYSRTAASGSGSFSLIEKFALQCTVASTVHT